MKNENLKVCGVYSILCTINNKRYIGSSVSIYQRWHSHKSLLGRGIHKNSHLLSTYKKYGKDCLEIHVIEECLEKDLIVREIYWIKHYKSDNNSFGYNQADPQRLSMTPEIRKKIGISHRGKKKPPRTEEHKRKISEALCGLKRSPMSEETKKKISDALINR